MFGRCQNARNCFTLELKKVWDPKDLSLYLSSQRFTTDGYSAYWEAVDKTIRYFDSVILKKNEKKKVQKPPFGSQFAQKEQLRWKNPKLNKHNFSALPDVNLPVPPARPRY